MAATCSPAALRLLTTVLVVTSIVNAMALPHQVLDSRSPIAQEASISEGTLSSPVASGKDKPKNFFDQITDLLDFTSARTLVDDLWEKLFGKADDNEGGADDGDARTTVYVTPTPPASAVTPPGPPMTTPADVSSSSTSDTAPASPTESDGMMSVLLVGDMSSGIKTTSLPFITRPATGLVPTSAPTMLPPYPANSTSSSILATAVSISGGFPVNSYIFPLSTGVSAPLSTGVPSNSTGTALPLPPYGNSPSTMNTTLSLTTTVLINATVTPSPILSTAPISAGTGPPIATSESPLYPNSSYTPSYLPGTASSYVSSSVAAASANTTANANTIASANTTATDALTFVIPPITVTRSAGSVLTIPLAPYANSTTCTESAAYGTGLPIGISESPVYSHASVTAPGTGSSASVGTGLPVSFSEAPMYPNTTTTTTAVVETATLVLPTPTVSDVAV